MLRPPARRPCPSCPYRRDVPSGVWDESEYEKLPEYDLETGEQPVGVFLCHQQDGRVCAGWASVHGDEDSLALRLAGAAGHLDLETRDAVLDYESPVPLFPTGEEAAAHGLASIEAPDEVAVRTIRKLERRRSRRSPTPGTPTRTGTSST